jgi:TorA maturation chaperone TorD
MADVCGFYRAFGLELPGGVSERPDSLAVELEFMAFLLMKGRLADEAIDTPEGIDGARAVCEEAAETFFKEHLAWWCPAFTVGLRRKAGSGVYAAAGQLLAAFLPLERARFGVSPQSLPSLPMAPEPEAEDDAKCASCVSAG